MDTWFKVFGTSVDISGPSLSCRSVILSFEEVLSTEQWMLHHSGLDVNTSHSWSDGLVPLDYHVSSCSWTSSLSGVEPWTSGRMDPNPPHLTWTRVWKKQVLLLVYWLMEWNTMKFWSPRVTQAPTLRFESLMSLQVSVWLVGGPSQSWGFTLSNICVLFCCSVFKVSCWVN